MSCSLAQHAVQISTALSKLHLWMFMFQPCFAEVELPESNFVDHIELLLKEPEERERFFQVCICTFTSWC